MHFIGPDNILMLLFLMLISILPEFTDSKNKIPTFFYLNKQNRNKIFEMVLHSHLIFIVAIQFIFYSLSLCIIVVFFI